MRVRETSQQRLAFEEGVRQWQEIEDGVIANCDEVAASTESMLVRTIADAIRADAVKHKEILETITVTLTGTITLTPDDLVMISRLLDYYVETEKDPIQMAAHERLTGEHLVVKQLLDYILADEVKYALFRDEFYELKKKIYPYGIS